MSALDLRARLKALEARLGVGQRPAGPRPVVDDATFDGPGGATADDRPRETAYESEHGRRLGPEDGLRLRDRTYGLVREPAFEPSSFTPSSAPPREPLEARLQRFAIARHDRPPRKSVTDEALARMLDGTLCADGVILVEQSLPISARHGRVRFADIHATALDFLAGGSEPDRDALIFIDTETTGLAGGTGTIAFLLGLARVREGNVEVRQYFLTRFAGEAAMLAHALEWITRDSHLVSFNGKTFDLPLLTTRYRMSRLAHPLTDLPHIDLLHRTRSAYKRNWPDCRLQTAERNLLKLFRDDDVPGHLIPQIWTDLLQHGETRDLKGVVEHNRLDILSLIALASVLGRTYAEPGQPQADPLGIARAHRRSGDDAMALRHLEGHSGRLDDAARLERAALYARAGDFDKAVPEWTLLAEADVFVAMERLAIYHEHRERDYASALHWTERMREFARDDGDVERRHARLARKSILPAARLCERHLIR